MPDLDIPNHDADELRDPALINDEDRRGCCDTECVNCVEPQDCP